MTIVMENSDAPGDSRADTVKEGDKFQEGASVRVEHQQREREMVKET